MASSEDIAEVLDTLKAIYDKQPGNIKAYAWTLAEYDKETLERAAQEHVKASKWFPKPSELVNLCERYKGSGYEHPPHLLVLANWWDYAAEELDEWAGRCENAGKLCIAAQLRNRAHYLRNGSNGKEYRYPLNEDGSVNVEALEL